MAYLMENREFDEIPSFHPTFANQGEDGFWEYFEKNENGKWVWSPKWRQGVVLKSDYLKALAVPVYRIEAIGRAYQRQPTRVDFDSDEEGELEWLEYCVEKEQHEEQDRMWNEFQQKYPDDECEAKPALAIGAGQSENDNAPSVKRTLEEYPYTESSAEVTLTNQTPGVTITSGKPAIVVDEMIALGQAYANLTPTGRWEYQVEKLDDTSYETIATWVEPEDDEPDVVEEIPAGATILELYAMINDVKWNDITPWTDFTVIDNRCKTLSDRIVRVYSAYNQKQPNDLRVVGPIYRYPAEKIKEELEAFRSNPLSETGHWEYRSEVYNLVEVVSYRWVEPETQ